jgi:hypothetical protein
MVLLSEEETREFWETSYSCPLDIGQQWKGKTFHNIQVLALCCFVAGSVVDEILPRGLVFHTGPIHVKIRGGHVTLGQIFYLLNGFDPVSNICPMLHKYLYLGALNSVLFIMSSDWRSITSNKARLFLKLEH